MEKTYKLIVCGLVAIGALVFLAMTTHALVQQPASSHKFSPNYNPQQPANICWQNCHPEIAPSNVMEFK